MGSEDSDSERSRDRDKAKRQKKIKKQKKDKKQKKEKKEKKEKKQKKQKHNRHESPSRERDNSHRDRYHKQQQPVNRIQSIHQKAIQKVFVPRTHIPCRRCQQQTFSLKLKQCTNCGYPKQQRPANFPVVKQIDVLELIRQGKMIHNSLTPVVIQIVVNDRMGRKERIKCHPDELIIDFKRLIAAQIGTRAQKIRLQKASIIFKDHLTLSDYQIKDGAGLEMYYD